MLEKEDNTGFGERLKALREQAGMTQQQLASASGLNRFGVAKLEQGVGEPRWPTVLALANALGVSCEAFTGEATTRSEQGRGRSKNTHSPVKRRKPKRGE